MAAFWIALIYVFLAEIGDKTQFMTIAFATRYKGRIVLAGVVVATALINLVSVGLGEWIGKLLPTIWINLVSGLAFIVFGIWELRPENINQSENYKESRFGPFVTVASALFLAEFGDKTMLATAAIAGSEHNFFQVWAGSTAGLVASNALAIFAGRAVKTKLSTKKTTIAIAVIYIVTGILAIVKGLTER
jgi:Ca2+/H+ antiporter, TMEM165/GDT1 family